MNKTSCFSPAHILLPSEQIPVGQWGCVACDQFTSDRSYWEKAAQAAAGGPSALNLILPEVYLEEDDVDARISAIHAAMDDYTRNVLTRAVDGFIYVERTEQSGRVRQGLVGRIDLEAYSYAEGAVPAIRPSEHTVESRIPPRMAVRRGARLETPHIMMLADDPGCTLIEPIGEKKEQLRKVYEGDLMLNGGHIAGWAVVYPVIVWVLLYGGFLGLERVETRQWGGLTLTLIIASVGIAGALPWGILLALGRRSKMPVVRVLSVIFIEFWRGVPLITVLFMSSVMLPLFMAEGTTIDKLIRALVGVILFQSAYVAEVVRGGLQALPKGQYEAAESLALGYWKTQGLVILPQALKLVIPGLVNTIIALFKDTSLVIIIGLFDLFSSVQQATVDPVWLGMSTEGYVFAALIYWIFCFSMSRYSQHLEKRFNTGRTPH